MCVVRIRRSLTGPSLALAEMDATTMLIIVGASATSTAATPLSPKKYIGMAKKRQAADDLSSTVGPDNGPVAGPSGTRASARGNKGAL